MDEHSDKQEEAAKDLLSRLRANPQWALYALGAGLLYYVAVVLMRRFPHSGDEFAYIYQANTLLAGRLVNPVPPFPPTYLPVHTVSSPWGMFGKYPPGWPALLAIGEALSIGFLAGPIIGVITLVRAYRLTKRLAGRESALALTALLATSSFFLFNSASFYPHSAVLLALVLIFDHLDRYRRAPSTRDALIAAAALGFIVLARPFDAALILGILLPVLATYFFRNLRRPLVRDTALAIGVQVLVVGIYLLYNKGTTNSFFTFGHQLADPLDKPSVDPSEMGRPLLLRAGRYFEAFWVVVLAPLALLTRRGAEKQDGPSRRFFAGLLAFSALFWVGYAAYLVPDLPPRYGPRYLYPTLFPLALMSAVALMRHFPPVGRWVALTLICLAQLLQTESAGKGIQLSIDSGNGIYEASTYLGAAVTPQKLLIGMQGRSGSIPSRDLIRNDLDFKQDVLFIRTPMGLKPPAPAGESRVRYVWDGIGGAPVLWSDEPEAPVPMFVLSTPQPTALPREERPGWVLITGSNHCFGEHYLYPGLRPDSWARVGPCPGPSRVSWAPAPTIAPREAAAQNASRFYAHYRSFLTIEEEQVLSFTLETSGGGALMRVGNIVVLDKDPLTEGGNGPGKARLKPGIYPMSVSYYHVEGPAALQAAVFDESGEPYPAEMFHTLPTGPVSFYGQLPEWVAASGPAP